LLETALSQHSNRQTFLIVLITLRVLLLQQVSRTQVAGIETNNASSNAAQSEDLSEARFLVDAGHFDEAERTLRKFLRTRPSSADGHFLLGLVLFRSIQAKASREGGINRNFEEQNAKASLAEYAAGSRLRDPTALDLKIVALDYVLLRDYVDADKWLTKSIALNPNDSEAWYYLGRAKYNEELFLEAIPVFQECLARDPKNVKAEDNLGLSYAALGRREEAITAYQKAIAWQTESLVKDSGPFVDLGMLLLDADRPGDAVIYLSQAVAISPNESRAHAGLGKAYSRMNNLAKAQDELETAARLAPDNGALHYVLGQVYRKQGLVDKAKAEFDRSAQLNGSHSSPVTDLPVRP
jgi:tetratricopeptide (TPR) repeat protein